MRIQTQSVVWLKWVWVKWAHEANKKSKRKKHSPSQPHLQSPPLNTHARQARLQPAACACEASTAPAARCAVLLEFPGGCVASRVAAPGSRIAASTSRRLRPPHAAAAAADGRGARAALWIPHSSPR